MIVMIFGTIYHSIIGNIVSANQYIVRWCFSAESLSYGITPILFGLLVAIPIPFMSVKISKFYNIISIFSENKIDYTTNSEL